MLDPENDPRRPGTIWVRNLDWPAPADATPRIPATFARAGPQDAEVLAQVMGHDSSASVQQRLVSGRRCYVVRVENTLAAYGWVSFDQEDIGELRVSMRLAPGEAYIWDCGTAPAYRRRRLYTALLAHIADALRDEGLCRVWIGAAHDNLASQNGIALAGFKPVADLIVARALALRLLWVKGRPGVPEWLVADARRALLADRDRAWLDAWTAAQAHQTSVGVVAPIRSKKRRPDVGGPRPSTSGQ